MRFQTNETNKNFVSIKSSKSRRYLNYSDPKGDLADYLDCVILDLFGF